ncbi:RNase A-like domain-containing protein [Jatrophihabitans sp.]|uniref:RNase A-like domain-containing protein n=1 Tax=Jatrophihabitans sp. TaxID=1932789 RepID=UPI0038CD3FBF
MWHEDLLSTGRGCRGSSTPHSGGPPTSRSSDQNGLHQPVRAVQLAGHAEELVLDGRASIPVGILIPRGSTESAAAQGIRILLRRSAKMENGYLLITAMVIE